MASKKKKNSNTGTKVLACIIAGAALGAHNGVQHAVHATLTSIPVAVPAAGSYGTRQAWAATFLAADGMPQTACNDNAVLAWTVREGGGVGNQAGTNPPKTIA